MASSNFRWVSTQWPTPQRPAVRPSGCFLLGSIVPQVGVESIEPGCMETAVVWSDFYTESALILYLTTGLMPHLRSQASATS